MARDDALDALRYGLATEDDFRREQLKSQHSRMEERKTEARLRDLMKYSNGVANAFSASGTLTVDGRPLQGSTTMQNPGVNYLDPTPNVSQWPNVGVVTTFGPISTYSDGSPKFDAAWDYAKNQPETAEQWLRRRVAETCQRSGLGRAA